MAKSGQVQEQGTIDQSEVKYRRNGGAGARDKQQGNGPRGSTWDGVGGQARSCLQSAGIREERGKRKGSNGEDKEGPTDQPRRRGQQKRGHRRISCLCTNKLHVDCVPFHSCFLVSETAAPQPVQSSGGASSIIVGMFRGLFAR
ncbi:uncharacterized protein SPSK_10480 [Sporothrix schenckii 1099-18]|uniref:Uncharacterized protein n=1 Tax=Sporothrix schenckii 1099-18 TaxID=1397361 RepID=A0A0F2MCH9_SPOSC|nr:uncharacterized protein SPSK_10480 [Sporothrix schenckii 1099-18]KJR86784.1 hypothetical protein SPSK_10480 [Sporothrix schenckii 1099-18]